MSKHLTIQKVKFILTLFLGTLILKVSAQIPSKMKGQWLYYDKYTFKYLSICDDNSFLWFTSGCTHSYHIAGAMKVVDDTLILVGSPVFNLGTQPKHSTPKTTLKFLLLKDQVFAYSENSQELPKTHGLERTKADNLYEAILLRWDLNQPKIRSKKPGS